MLCLGGWVPGALSHGWLPLPEVRNNGCLLTFHLPNSEWFLLNKDHLALSLLSVCFYSQKTKASLLGVQRVMGRAHRGAQVEPVPSPGQAVPPGVDMHSLPVPLPQEGPFLFAQRPWTSSQLGADHWSGLIPEGISFYLILTKTSIEADGGPVHETGTF